MKLLAYCSDCRNAGVFEPVDWWTPGCPECGFDSDYQIRIATDEDLFHIEEHGTPQVSPFPVPLDGLPDYRRGFPSYDAREE